MVEERFPALVITGTWNQEHGRKDPNQRHVRQEATLPVAQDEALIHLPARSFVSCQHGGNHAKHEIRHLAGRPHISQVVLDIGDVSLQPKNHQAGPQGNAPKQKKRP